MGGLLTLVISFLARLVGLGKVSDAVVNIVNKIRAPIDKALDKVVEWIVATAKKLGKLVAQNARALFSWAFAKKTFKDGKGVTHSFYVNDGALMVASTPQAAGEFVGYYVKKNGDPKGIEPKITSLITKAAAVAAEIAKISATTPEGTVPAPDKQKELLALSMQIRELLAALVGGDRDVGKAMEKYKLEDRSLRTRRFRSPSAIN